MKGAQVLLRLHHLIIRLSCHPPLHLLRYILLLSHKMRIMKIIVSSGEGLIELRKVKRSFKNNDRQRNHSLLSPSDPVPIGLRLINLPLNDQMFCIASRKSEGVSILPSSVTSSFSSLFLSNTKGQHKKLRVTRKETKSLFIIDSLFSLSPDFLPFFFVFLSFPSSSLLSFTCLLFFLRNGKKKNRRGRIYWVILMLSISPSP